MDTTKDIYIGIDVSKGWLDVDGYPESHRARLTNDEAGHAALIEMLAPLAPKCVLQLPTLLLRKAIH